MIIIEIFERGSTPRTRPSSPIRIDTSLRRDIEHRVREALRLNRFDKYGWYPGQAHCAARRYHEATAVLKSLSDPTAISSENWRAN